MRMARIKVDAHHNEAVYHCMSRTVNGEFLFSTPDQEALRRQLWTVAEYCGVKILTYTILSNHFHVLVRVPVKQPLSDGELLRRYRILYPRPTRFRLARPEVIEAQLAAGGPEAEHWRMQQTALMGDVSQFMKLLKARFTIWYNRRHDRFGTLWAERFKSVLVESGKALTVMAAYIDRNCKRANITKDPKDYRFCGYAEALAGSTAAREGIAWALGGKWRDVAAAYHVRLLEEDDEDVPNEDSANERKANEVEAFGRKLRLTTLLNCRIKYFSDGAVLGSREFVARHLEEQRKRFGRVRGLRPTDLPAIPQWEGLAVLRACRNVEIA